MDRKVGELLDALEENGLADNTIVVFASDHGDMLCEKEMVQKRCFYEWSCRVPFIVRFPDKWKAGTTCNTPVSLLDLLPTFCDLAGTEATLPHDGHSLIPTIDGADPDRTVIAQAHEAVGVPCIMARQHNYKYNYIHGYDAQLFDLDADPGEWHNLCGDAAHSNAEESLRTHILDHFDPDAMASANLESLYRRRLISGVMTEHGHSWAHFPKFDARRNALDQHLP